MKFAIEKGRQKKALKVVVYGPEGVGKSTLASRFPGPLFIDTEGGTAHMDVARLPSPTSWKMLEEEIDAVTAEPDVCRTLVIDTADGAQKLCYDAVCAERGVDGIEGLGYGKGYVYAGEKFGKLLNRLERLADKGVNVLVLAHAIQRKVELPEETGAYDHWEMKLHQKQISPLLKEWADALLFATYKTIVIQVDKEGNKNKAKGSERVIYTTHSAAWDAKNRHGLPDRIPLSIKALAPLFENVPDAPQKAVEAVVADTKPEPVKPPKVEKKAGEKPAEKPAEKPVEKPQEAQDDDFKIATGKAAMDANEAFGSKDNGPYKGVDRRLADLMRPEELLPWDIETVCQAKGFAAFGQKLADYPVQLINAIIKQWDKIAAQAKKARVIEELPC